MPLGSSGTHFPSVRFTSQKRLRASFSGILPWPPGPAHREGREFTSQQRICQDFAGRDALSLLDTLNPDFQKIDVVAV